MLAIDESTRPFPHPAVEAYELLDEMVLYRVEEGVVLSLNRTARAIWELCDGRRTVGEIVTALENDLDDQSSIERERLLADVCTAVSQLHDADVLEIIT